jgi:hypothetical protein
MPPLYKTTVVVWSPSPDAQVTRKDLDKPTYCAKYTTEIVVNPVLDPDWDPSVEFVNGDFHCLDERKVS